MRYGFDDMRSIDMVFNQNFGASLAVGNFDGSSRDELAVGVPGKYVNSALDAGEVSVFYNLMNTNSVSTGGQTWNQNSSGIGGGSESGDHFGDSLATGDFNGDSIDDLAVGVPGEAISSNSVSDAGMVNVK